MPDHGREDQAKKVRRVSVEISPDGMEAFITLGAVPKLAPVTAKEVREDLSKSGVVPDCIIEGEIDRLVTSGAANVKVAVARGTAPAPGVDGRVEYFFDYESMGKPRLDEAGRADHRNLNLIINVKAGDRLAVLHPPAPGIPGRSVTGKDVPPPEPLEASLMAGPGARADEANPNLIVAAADGAVAVRDETIRVDPVMELPGDVDYATGNIDFRGALTIKGDVKPGFSVRSDGSLVVLGTVEDADVGAGEDLTVMSGCVGTGKGSLEAGGSVFVRFAERQRISARRDVVAGEYLLNCTVRAGNAVKASEKQGLILGGEITAASSVTAKVLGNDQGVATKITVGYSGEVLAKLKELGDRERQALENTKKVRKGFDVLKRIKIIKRELPNDKKELLAKLAEVSKKLQAVIDEARRRKEEILAELGLNEDMSVAVLEAAYPGVSIFFRETGYRVESKEQCVTYRLMGGAIKKTFSV